MTPGPRGTSRWRKRFRRVTPAATDVVAAQLESEQATNPSPGQGAPTLDQLLLRAAPCCPKDIDLAQ